MTTCTPAQATPTSTPDAAPDGARWTALLTRLEELQGRPLEPSEGMPLSEIEHLERTLDFQLPAALREFYHLFAYSTAVRACRARIRALEELELTTDFGPTIAVGERGVCSWYLADDWLQVADPLVHVEGPKELLYLDRPLPLSQFYQSLLTGNTALIERNALGAQLAAQPYLHALENGRYSREQLRLAAFLGDRGARATLGDQAPRLPISPLSWMRGLARWGRAPCVRALLDVGRYQVTEALLPLGRWLRAPYRHRDTVEPALRAVIAHVREQLEHSASPVVVALGVLAESALATSYRGDWSEAEAPPLPDYLTPHLGPLRQPTGSLLRDSLSAWVLHAEPDRLHHKLSMLYSLTHPSTDDAATPLHPSAATDAYLAGPTGAYTIPLWQLPTLLAQRALSLDEVARHGGLPRLLLAVYCGRDLQRAIDASEESDPVSVELARLAMTALQSSLERDSCARVVEHYRRHRPSGFADEDVAFSAQQLVACLDGQPVVRLDNGWALAWRYRELATLCGAYTAAGDQRILSAVSAQIALS